ncbi:MAG: PASTA domain-containing protein [Pseudomonadota bacterium]
MKSLVLALAALALGGLAAVCLAQDYQPDRQGWGAVRGRVQTPAVTGLAEAEARQVLQQAGLQARLRRLKADPDCDDPALVGLVLRQSPAPETLLRRGAWVDLGVCPGQRAGRRLTMPAVVGLTVAEARAALARLGLKPRLQRRSICPGPELTGRVTGQRPAPGQQVRPGLVVVLTHCPER